MHNGIIENAEQLRDALSARGVKLVSDTDTEALAHMIAAEATAGVSLEDAVRRTLRHVEGTYGLVVLDTKNPNELVVARNGSPIVLGIGESEMFVASDVAALVRYTKQVVYLDDAEVATVHAADYLTSAIDERDRRGPGAGPEQGADHGGGRGRRLRARPVRELHAQGDPRAAGGAAPGAARPPRRAVRHRQAGRHQPGRAPAPGRSGR